MGACLDLVNGQPGGTPEASVDTRTLLPLPGLNPSTLGMPFANSGTVSYVAPTGGTTLRAITPVQRWTSAVGAGSTSGVRSNTLTWFREGTFGGFDFRFVFALGSFNSGNRAFVGVRNPATAIPGVDPSTLTNIVGIAFNTGASQWSLMHNDGAGAATTSALGASFNVATTDLLGFRVVCDAGQSGFDWAAENLTSGAVASGSVTTDIPAITLGLSYHVWGNTGSAILNAILVDVARIDVIRPLLWTPP